ncbi:MAG: ATP-grasp domain-containing protein [Candidatus Shapirobacteria bacterium]|jgi:predicted ATP-grasp superfamily ATP-dependent carboligase
MTLIDALNQSPYSFYFLVVDKFLDIEISELKNFEKIYLSDYPSVKIKNSSKLLSNPQIIDYILKKSQKNNLIPAIISFKPSSKIDFLCKKNNWVNINNSGLLNRFLENKIKFSNLCTQFNLPTIPFIVDTFNQENFIKYQQVFDQKLVIQLAFGWAGKSTFSSDNYDEIKDKITTDIPVKFSPYIAGYSLLNNCCLTKKGLIQSPPAIQYTGISPFTTNPFTTVGRQWPSLAPIEIIEKIKNITQEFSNIIKNLNYKGFFGLDFLIHNDEVYLLECNPRLTASFAFYNEIEIKQNINSLFLFHLAEFINLDFDINLELEQKRFYNSKIIGSEITTKNNNSQTIKKYHDFTIFSDQIDPIIIPQKIIDLINEN